MDISEPKNVGVTMRAIMHSFGRHDMQGDVVEELAFHIAESRMSAHRLCMEFSDGSVLERPGIDKALSALEWELEHLSGHIKSGIACLKKVRKTGNKKTAVKRPGGKSRSAGLRPGVGGSQ